MVTLDLEDIVYLKIYRLIYLANLDTETNVLNVEETNDVVRKNRDWRI